MAFFEQDDVGTLIGSIYEAALDSTRWNDFLVQFSARLNSSAALIWGNDFSDRSVDIHGNSGSISTYHGFDPAAMETFAAYYCQRNVWTEDPLLHKEGFVVTSSGLYPDADLKHTEYYNDWLRPQDLFYSSAAIVSKRDDRSLNVTLVRSQNAGTYTPNELKVINSLMPHLQAAFALHRRLHRLEALNHATTGALEASPFGVILLDERTHILHANSLAQRLAKQSGLLRFGNNNSLHAVSYSDNATLQHCLHGAVMTGKNRSGGSGGALRLKGSGDSHLDLVTVPLPGWASPFGEHSAAAVFISNPKTTISSLSDRLKSLYGMTPAEAKLTEALVRGLTPQEYAERQQLSLHTVRAQFKTAASKAGTNRQADLVRIVLTGPAVLPAR